ncbi:Neurogenic locu protein delta [Taenia crassiceps]|uniref:Delta-like protein n=1 Tax=Taenia crassiceps TaxID=6207 RepID=A0ABR4QRM7_9CEST
MLFAVTFLLPFVHFCNCKSYSTDIPGKLELELTYANPGHYSSSGWCDFFARTCDVYFVICIWSADQSSPTECGVAKKTTHVIGPHSRIDEMIELPLSNNIPKLIKMRIEAWDSDLSTADDLIAKFVSTEVPISSHTDFRIVDLSKQEETSYNEEVKIEASVKLTCSSHYYGEQCETYCKPDYRSFYCGENGERKCIPGWYGKFCHKVDNCFLKPCAPYAICSNTDDEEGRICYCNGGSGLECYQVQDPCDPSPCHNGGVCTKTGSHLEQFLCECKEFWYGPTCDQRHSACEWEKRILDSDTNSSTEVCLNGGVCQDNPTEFGYTCLCSSGWKGKHCEEPDYTAVIAAATVIPIVLIIVTIFILLVRRTRWSSRFNRPSIAIKGGQQSTKYSRNADETGRVEAISNEIYGEVPLHAVPVEVLSAEDEYAMLDAAPQPQVDRKSYEGAVRYASLLWDSPPDLSPEKPTDDKMGVPSPLLVPPRPKSNEITKPLTRSSYVKSKSQILLHDRPSENIYERTKDDIINERRTPLPFRNQRGL